MAHKSALVLPGLGPRTKVRLKIDPGSRSLGRTKVRAAKMFRNHTNILNNL